ncbi:MAG: hypothetical protein A3K18_32900 [Lentisphaerae bacterium RIFOXYA12_64_32]|nr:MAG: hypothetical protein A3K18_32900 [Lentisphaerae bacterium RIFOXYA12_64_32]
MSITSTDVKEAARQFGADLVGIGDISRFEGVKPENDPRFIAPKAKTIIGLGFRVLRGSLRGIEEGTQYYQYSTMGVMHIDELFAPATLRRLACFLEDNGYDGAVYRAVTDRRPASNTGTEPERGAIYKLEHAEPVAPGKPAPDVLMDFRLAAVICGLGEIGHGGFVLTPEFGPLQRFAFILTDAPLEPDPMLNGPRLCDRCGKCATACPGQALNPKEPTQTKLAEFAVEHAKLDEWQCAAHYQGANRSINPFLASDKLKPFADAAQIASGQKQMSEAEVRKLLPVLGSAYPGVGSMYPSSLCGRACYRACLVHLEEQGKLTKKYHAPFRRGPVWALPA